MNSYNRYQLSPAEQNLTNQLKQIIIHEIENSNMGVISFARYMELALYYPQLGYYSNGLFKFGKEGDFITAPLVSNVFGHLIAHQLQELFCHQVAPIILEFGAGNGKLCCDILASLGDTIENYYILELSANLQLWQSELLASKVPQYAHKVVWLDKLPDNFNGVILANEVLDAQPCNLIQFTNDANLVEMGVKVTSNQKLACEPFSSNTKAVEHLRNFGLKYSNYTSEVNLRSLGFINSLADCLSSGAVLLIDYGYGASEYYHPERSNGTLRGFFRHNLIDDVLLYPGLCDITASVEWSSLVNQAEKVNLDLVGYTNQANFLINCGLTSLLEQAQANLPEEQYLILTKQINQLIAPNIMGEAFKVCGLSKNLKFTNWLGFSHGDRSYALT
ncbi:MAG: hypothetical protein RLZZ293_937 [Pseudomonadota bacterium]|jgi:SAM-dependent MidA family methyltransferase